MFMKQDRLLKDAMRELAESLDAQRVEPLNSGVGIGKLKPINAPWTPVLQAQPQAVPMPTTVPGPDRMQVKAQQPTPQSYIPRLERPTPPQIVPSVPRSSFATLSRRERSLVHKGIAFLVAHMIDVTVIVCTLAVGMLLLQTLFNDQHPFAGRAAMTQVLLQTAKDLGWPMLLGTVYGLFLAYWLFFKILAGYTIGQFILAPSPHKA